MDYRTIKINTIINRYIFKEMIPPFLINLMVFTFIFLMAKILDITKLIVNYNINILTVLLLLVCSIPSFLIFVLPMSIMMGVLMAFLRLSSDNEIIAMKASGINIYSMLPPVILFSLIGLMFTSFLTIYASSKGYAISESVLTDIISSNANIGLKERTFNSNFKDVMLYVNKIDISSGILEDIFIQDKRDTKTTSTIIASKGQFISNPDNMIFQLRLNDGFINQVDQIHKSVYSINFESYNFNLDLKEILSKNKKQKSRKEMSIQELRDYLMRFSSKDSDYYLILMEYYKKYSIPFACLVLGVLAVPLGIQTKTPRRSLGVATGLIFFLLYYIMLSFGMGLGESGTYPPLLSMWTPNIIMGIFAIYLLINTSKERQFEILNKIKNIKFKWLYNFFKKKK